MRRVMPLFVFLAGCPEPVATTDGAMSQPTGGISSMPTTPSEGPGSMGPGGDAGGGTNPGTAISGGPGAAPDADLEPRFEQADIKDAWVISGTIACGTCEGDILLRVLPPPPDQGGADEEIHLITRKSYSSAGEFEIKVPKKYTMAVLQVVDDGDSDGKPGLGESMGIPISGPTELTADVSGIELVVGVFPEAPALDSTGQPLADPSEIMSPSTEPLMDPSEIMTPSTEPLVGTHELGVPIDGQPVLPPLGDGTDDAGTPEALPGDAPDEGAPDEGG